MAELDELAQRAVATVNTLAARGATLATGISGVVGVVAVVVYLLGIAALEGSTRTGWLIVGAVLVIIAVGAPLLARWRLDSVRRHAGELVAEVKTLLHQGSNAQRIVVDTFDRSEPGAADAGAGGVGRQAIVIQTRQFSDLRNLASSVSDLRRLPAAMTAVTTFPGLLAIGLILTLVFLVLGFVFLIAWIV